MELLVFVVGYTINIRNMGRRKQRSFVLSERRNRIVTVKLPGLVGR